MGQTTAPQIGKTHKQKRRMTVHQADPLPRQRLAWELVLVRKTCTVVSGGSVGTSLRDRNCRAPSHQGHPHFGEFSSWSSTRFTGWISVTVPGAPGRQGDAQSTVPHRLHVGTSYWSLATKVLGKSNWSGRRQIANSSPLLAILTLLNRQGNGEVWVKFSLERRLTKSVTERKSIHSALAEPNTKHQELWWRKIGYFTDEWRHSREGKANDQKPSLSKGM